MNFKNIKKNPPVGEKKNKYPSNFRTITDPTVLLKIYRGTLKVFIAVIFLAAVAIVGLDLDANIKTKQAVDLEREKLTQELVFWESFIKKQENYRDAYFQASVLEYKLGNTSKAKKYIEKGIMLDPNSESGQRLEQLLSK